MSWKSLPGHSSWSERNRLGDALSPWPPGGCESRTPLAGPPLRLPSASELLALLWIALQAACEGAQEAHGGMYWAGGTDRGRCRAAVHLERGAVGVSQER